MIALEYKLEPGFVGHLCSWLASRGVACRFEKKDTTTLLHLRKGDRSLTINPEKMGQGDDIYTLAGQFAST